MMNLRLPPVTKAGQYLFAGLMFEVAAPWRQQVEALSWLAGGTVGTRKAQPTMIDRGPENKQTFYLLLETYLANAQVISM